MTTGNSVADYRVVYKTCPLCDGDREVRTSDGETAKEKMRWLFDAGYLMGMTLAAKKEMWRELKEYGATICPECFGAGRIEEWR